MAKVLLINPPWYRLQGAGMQEIPLGVCYLASFLNKHGHHATVLNADFQKRKGFTYKELYDHFGEYTRILNDLRHPLWQEIMHTVEQQNPHVVGISIKTGAYKSACNIASLIKEKYPDIMVVAGGSHPTLLPRQTLQESVFDVVVKKEGEQTFLELIHAYEHHQRLHSIKGIVWRENGDIRENIQRDYISCLDEIPFPERDAILGRGDYLPQAFAIMMTGRGCPYQCTFCASEKMWDRKVRLRSPENVLEEMKYLKRHFQIHYLQIRDDLFTLHKKRAIEICNRMIQDKLHLRWQCEVRGDSLDDALVRKMRDAGCIGANIGVESGSAEMLATIKKGETLAQIEQGIRLLKKYGINVGAFIMVGFPDETEHQIAQTLAFVKKTQPDHVILSIATPYPGTVMYEEAKEKGLISEVGWECYFHQSPSMGLARDKKEFARIARRVMREVSCYNKNVVRRTKRKLFQIIANPKAVANTVERVFRNKFYGIGKYKG